MIIVILIYVSIAFLQIPKLLRNKHWRELTAFLVFYVSAFILSVLYVLDVKLPSAYKSIIYVIEDVLGLKY